MENLKINEGMHLVNDLEVYLEDIQDEEGVTEKEKEELDEAVEELEKLQDRIIRILDKIKL